MYELFIGNKNYSSWSMRPWVLMRQLGIGFTEQLRPFHLNKGEGDFRKFSPSGKVPLLVHGDYRVWDSLAIAEFLAERHPGVWPALSDARAFARCAAAEMHSGFGTLRNECSMSVGVRVRLHSVTGRPAGGSGAARRAVGAGHRTVRRSVPGRPAIHRR